VWAAKDPGTTEAPGTDLQRIQIVKGWVDAAGETHEQVFDVAGDANGSRAVDPVTCRPVEAGASELCATWRDPGFDPAERAFYYARVLESPTCRWSVYLCRQLGVDPLSPECSTQADATGEPRLAGCCRGPADDPFLDPVIQERAWTSPVWYRPETFARLDASVRFGRKPGSDVLRLRGRVERWPAGGDTKEGFDPAVHDLTLRVTDDDEVFAVTIPAGALRAKGHARWTLPADAARSLGLARFVLRGRPGGAALLRLTSVRTNLGHAAREDHAVSVTLDAGTAWQASHVRLWRAGRRRLGTRGS
jgi:Protein of unknown function (DUF3604)